MKLLSETRLIAKALNFNKYPVLTWDLDSKTGSKARAPKQSRNYGEMLYNCVLQRGYKTEDDGILYLMTKATMLKAHYSVSDFVQDAEFANAPIIKEGQEVAILLYSKELGFAAVQMVKAGKVNPDYSTATVFQNIDE